MPRSSVLAQKSPESLTDGSARHQRDGKDLLVCAAGLTRNQARPAQALDTEPFLGANDGYDAVPHLAVLLDPLRHHVAQRPVLEALLLLRRQVQVLEAHVRSLLVDPRD